jgi:hypothetical protein
MFDLKWEIGILLGCYARRAATVDWNDFDGEKKLKDLYAQAMILNVQHGYGLFYPIDDFMEEVCGGFYIDSDGSAKLLDGEGNFIRYTRCDLRELEKAKVDGAVYVAWFNK